MERAEAALGGLSLTPPVLHTTHVLHPLVVPDGSFKVERGDELRELCGGLVLPLCIEQL